MFSKRKIEVLIIFLYTLLTLKVVYPFLFYVFPNTWGEFLDSLSMFTLLNNNLMALCIGIFLNAFLILYFKILIKKKYEVIVLVIYTLINLKLLSTPFLYFFSSWYDQAPNFNLLALFTGLFLNTALVLYWMRKNTFGVEI